MAWQAFASMGLDLASNYKNTQLNDESIKAQQKSIDEMLKNLQKQQEELRSAYSTRKEIATDIYGNKVTDVTYKARVGLESLGKQYGQGTAQTGLAYSGTLYDKAKEGEQGIKYDLTSTKRDLENQLGQTLADIMIKETQDMSNIENTMTQLKGQRNVLKKIQDESDTSFWNTLIDPLNTGMWDNMGTGQSAVDIFLQGGVGSLANRLFS